MVKYISTIGLLFLSNAFMTMAWYGHLKFFGKNGHQAALWVIVLISWGLPFLNIVYWYLPTGLALQKMADHLALSVKSNTGSHYSDRVHDIFPVIF
ncbi:MAG: hypothetical protein NVS3B8_05830 [Chitinophagaceae bacterium]